MSLHACPPLDEQVVPDSPTTPIKWTAGEETRLASIAKARRIALEAQSKMYAEVDPLVRAAAERTAKSQQYWETLVFEAGQIAHLNPQQSHNVSNFLAEFIGVKLGAVRNIRNPLLNARRIAVGLAREIGIYGMINRMENFQAMLREVAKQRGVTLDAEDIRRFLEEGLSPQRLAVYGNTDLQQARLIERFNQFTDDMIGRGFNQDDLEILLEEAQTVSSQWDELAAVQQGMGLHIGDLFNIGYMPRQLTDTGFSLLASAKDQLMKGGGESLFTKSRSTFEYLVEDHTLAAAYLRLEEDKLAELIANPADFAEFLSKNTTGEQLDTLVDSGIFSKIPMFTTDVAEMMTRSYDLPESLSKELFIADPRQATAKLVENLTTQLENSALLKFVREEGAKAGWVIPLSLKQGDDKFKDFVLLSEIVGDALAGNKFDYIHPDVATHLKGLMRFSQDPAELHNAARVWNWFIGSFRKQALGGPVTATVYIGRQFMSNLLSVFGSGASSHHFFTSVADMVTLGTKGLGAFDDTKPFRIIDGEVFTQRGLIARVMRNFSHETVPGLNLDSTPLIDFEAFNPRYIRRQFGIINETGKTRGEYLKVLGRIGNRMHDGVLTPALKIAQLLDMAGQLAVVKGHSIIPDDLGRIVEGVAQTTLGLGGGKKATWSELQDIVNRTFPMMDDIGKVAETLSYVVPFKVWAMGNLPVQIADMMRQPTRWMNYGRAYALWNQNAFRGDEPVKGEMKQWEMDQYGLVLRRDPETKQTHIMFTSQYDPKWGALTWMAQMFPNELTPEEKRDHIQGKDMQQFFSSLAAESYLGGVYKIASGIDPLTGVRRDESPLTFKQFANIPMPSWMAAVLSLSPFLASVDRLPVVSGTRQVEDARTGEVLIPAMQGWLGNAGTLTNSRLEGLESTVQTLGAKIRVIDGLKNMQYTEKSVAGLQKELLSKYRAEQLRLASDLQTGAVPRGSETEAARVRALHLMVDTIIQLNVDLERIQLWAAVNNLPSSEALTEYRNRRIAAEQLPLPSSDYMREQLNKAMELKK